VRSLRVLAAVVLVSTPALAHHRQTPPVVPFTASGDAALPRMAPPSRKAAAAVVDDAIVVVSPFKDPTTPLFTYATGTNANPSISYNGKTVVWDSDAMPPGRQVLRSDKLGVAQATNDASGTSTNAAVDELGLFVAFESAETGTSQVFLRTPDGTITQISTGMGTSRNGSVAFKGRRVAFESTSDPSTDADTGVAQIWVAELALGTTAPITSGAIDSRNPVLSLDGRLVAFDSRADLAGDGSDTGVSQVFVYDTKSKTFARLTNDPDGCSAPSAMRIQRDWRIAYLCNGVPSFTMLRADARFRVQTDPTSDTQRILPQGDVHFLLVATTSDLLSGSGVTTGHRVYMVNLFKRPPEPVAGNVLWFPTQGIPSL
jgi:hypothetical protein